MIKKKNPPANAEDSRNSDSVPGLRRLPRVGNGKPLWYSCMENSMDGGAWWTTVHGVAKSQIQLSTRTDTHVYIHTHTHTHTHTSHTQIGNFNAINLALNVKSFLTLQYDS